MSIFMRITYIAMTVKTQYAETYIFLYLDGISAGIISIPFFEMLNGLKSSIHIEVDNLLINKQGVEPPKTEVWALKIAAFAPHSLIRLYEHPEH